MLRVRGSSSSRAAPFAAVDTMTGFEGGNVISQRVQAAAVVLFALVIAGVVYVLLTRADQSAPEFQEPSAGDDPGSSDEGPVGRLVLTAGKGDVVVRYRYGSCSEAGGPKLELSRNQGRTFHEFRVPQVGEGTGVGGTSPVIQAIVAATATSPLKLTIAGADEECIIHRYTTDDGGQTWNEESGAVDEWYIDPRSGDVVSPRGPTDPGCKRVGALAPVSDTAAKVFCSGGVVRSTSDGGVRWTQAGRLKRVAAAVFTDAQTGYAAVSEPGCLSRIHVTVDGGFTWSPRGCVIEEFAIPGLTGTDELLVAGGPVGVRLSTNGGKKWKPPTMK